jgi:hypothetical protein|uniref:Uncharacterized protein n=1 Tax=Picea glauca TaxID=3330 RepID=A0A101LXX2_PICGL|nr:hypothetical protein ABT39_MTgene5574 [Picea glauca]QHR89572.1 hypothetical protein Q903MT_gene3594 [Picea sitchensis]
MLLADPMKHGALVHSTDNLCQLCHRRLGHLHYGALPLLKNGGTTCFQGGEDKTVQGMCTQQAFQDCFPKQ